MKKFFKKIQLILFGIFCTINVVNAQEHENKNDSCRALITELEIYPLNISELKNEIVKVEAMFDYHDLVGKKQQILRGVRFFGDANFHWKEQHMHDLIWYTEGYIGYNKYLQLGGELGSISDNGYIGLGPQFTYYCDKFFKRFSINTRIWPSLVLGYEYTTEENIGRATISSTGMGRFDVKSNQLLLQASLWLSFKKMHRVYYGVEYEYNNTHSELPHDVFGGIKLEF